MPLKAESGIQDLRDLVCCLHQDERFADVITALEKGLSATIGGAWGSACALTAASLAQKAPQTLLVVLPRLNDVDEFADDISGFLGEVPLIFPAWEGLPNEKDVADAVFGGRLRVLRALTDKNPPRIVVSSFPALLQPVASGCPTPMRLRPPACPWATRSMKT